MNRVVNLRKQEESRVPQVKRIVPAVRPKPIQQAARTPLSESADSALSWQVHHTQSGSRRVTLFVGVLAFLAALVFVFQQNILLAVLLVLGAITFVITPREHHHVRASLEPHGVVVNGATYYYRDLESFWVEYIPGGVQELSLRVARWYLPYVKVPLGDRNPNHIRTFLVEFLPEEQHESSLVDALMRFLKVY